MATQAELIAALPNSLANLPNAKFTWDMTKEQQTKLWAAVQELQRNQLLIIQALQTPEAP